MVMVIKNESNKPFKLLRLVKNKHMELLQNRSTLNSAIFYIKNREATQGRQAVTTSLKHTCYYDSCGLSVDG